MDIPNKEDLGSLWQRYAPRLLADGVIYRDMKEVEGLTQTWDDWCGAWCKVAARYEALGKKALKQKDRVSAGEWLWLASLYYHYGQFVFWQNFAEKNRAQRRKAEIYTLAAPHLVPPAHRIEIPFEKTVLPGYLRLPAGKGRHPCVILIGGLESTKEESYLFENLCLTRGVATFAFDGPGQGEVYFKIPMRMGFEKAVSTVIDYLERRKEIRKDRIGVLGRSLGGYYAPLAAGYDSRVAAGVAFGAFYDFDQWDYMPPIIKDGFQFVTKTQSWEEAARYLKPFTLEGVASKIRCPLYILHGDQDIIIRTEQARRMAREARGKVEFVVVKGGNHCCHNLANTERPKMADWLARNLQR